MTTMTATRPAIATPRTTEIPKFTFGRTLATEFRKLFSTRANVALMVLVVAAATIVAGAMISSLDSLREFEMPWVAFVSVINSPIFFLLAPLIIVLVTTEWTNRSAMTTFTLAPRRGWVVLAKVFVALAVAVTVWALTVGLAALTNQVGSNVHDLPLSWEAHGFSLAGIGGVFLLRVAFAFAMALLLHNASAAIVITLSAPMVLSMVMEFLPQSAEFISWIHLIYAAESVLVMPDAATATMWAKFAVAVTIWIIIPATLGTTRTLRREVS